MHFNLRPTDRTSPLNILDGRTDEKWPPVVGSALNEDGGGETAKELGDRRKSRDYGVPLASALNFFHSATVATSHSVRERVSIRTESDAKIL